ncbi:glutamine amidotransferase-related protein [Lacticaseibacillus manihotivorans]
MFTVQYHPEANPGPKDASGFFNQFKQLMEKKVAAHA